MIRRAQVRGFTYELEPAREQREWMFNAAQMRLANAQREFNEHLALQQQLEAECKVAAERAGQAWASKRDPASQARMLGFLANLRQRQVENEQAILRLAQQLEQVRQDCIDRQQGLEALEQHRNESLKDFAREAERKFAVQADQDWVARNSYASGGNQ